jgi:chromosome segregation ATPase
MATRQEILSELAVVERELAEAERELQRLNALFVEQTDPAAIRIISQQIEQVSRTRNTLINRKTQLQRQLNSADAAVTTSTPTYSTASDTPGVIAAGGAVTPGAVPGPTTAQPTPTAANGAVGVG